MKKLVALALTVTIVLLTIITLLILDIHHAGEKEVINRFRAHQILIVRQLVQNIEEYLKDRSRGSQVVSSLTSVQERDLSEMRVDIEDYFQFLKKIYVKDVTVYNENGVAIYSTTPDSIGRNAMKSDFFQWLANKQEGDRQFVGLKHSDAPNQTNTFVIIATPVYRKVYRSRVNPQEKFSGALTITIDLPELIVDSMSTSTAGVTRNEIWVIDTTGTILFQPEPHPVTAISGIRQTGQDCLKCHVSLGYIDRIVSRKTGTIDYTMRDGSEKIAAFSPLSFKNLSLIVAITAPRGEVSWFLKKQLTETLLLIGIIGIVLSGAFIYTYHNTQLKIRAEEEARQWRTKQELEEKIRLSEEQYRRLVEISPDAIVVHSQGKITFVNDAAMKLIGASTPEELLGKSIFEFVHPKDIEVVKRRITEILDKGKSVPRIEEQFIRLDGTTIDVEVTAAPTTYYGKPAIQVIARDISERKKAEQARSQIEEIRRQHEERHKSIVENIFTFIPEGVLVLTNKLQHFSHNKKFDEIVEKYSKQLGYTQPELTELIIKEVKKYLSTLDDSQSTNASVTLRIQEKQNEKEKNSSNNSITNT